MPPLPEPKVLRLVDNEGFSDEAPYIWGFFAHGYDTGMEPYFSDEQMHNYAKAYAAPLIARVAELQAERDRFERNRDMWKGQCERQAEKLTALHAQVAAMENATALQSVELFGTQSANRHLSALVDFERQVSERCMAVMKALMGVATPIECEDMDCQIPGADYAQFVNDHAELLYVIANGDRPAAIAAKD